MNTLPTGIQDFATLRERGHVYVDKTEFLQPLLASGGYYFLSRPRRFGKSLLVSTLKAIYDGRKELFNGLWLEHNHDFAVHPVIRIDFSNINFTDKSLDQGVVDWLKIIALEYELVLQSTNARDAFRELILDLSKTAKVVVLVDEYDKPITDHLLESEKRAAHQAVLRGLYGVLKPLNEYLELVFLTGVSKIGKLSLFSDLNNLHDISLEPQFAQICGYSREEIEKYFSQYLENLATDHKKPLEALWVDIKQWYNGFSWDGKHRLYCPFSFLLFLSGKQFRSYWYTTATPTFLLELIRAAKLNPLELDPTEATSDTISSANLDRPNLTGLMFQTGYLTILLVEPSPMGVVYTLGYPNFEVRQAFSNELILEYSQSAESFNIQLWRMLEKHDWDKFFAKVNQILATIPYEIFKREEVYAHSLLHLMLLSTGFAVQSQVPTSLGRIDILLTTQTHQIIFELKTSGTPEDALLQIEKNRYADGLTMPVVQVGAVFDFASKSFVAWASR
jgi:Predicted AAA-ATPase/PD-(D/E)XK nuclease superfamily